MEIAIIAAICVINFGISWWNAYVCGKVWEDSKANGGFLRVLVWCAAIQSAIGFSSVYVIVIMAGLTPFLDLQPEDLQYMWKFTMSFWYLIVIFPVLGTGLIITIHSWMNAIRTRSLGSAAVAGWNTYAQVSNTVSAASNLGEVFSVVGEGFSQIMKSGGSGKDAAKGKVIVLAILIVIVALMLGALTTAMLIQYYGQSAVRAVAPKKEKVAFGR